MSVNSVDCAVSVDKTRKMRRIGNMDMKLIEILWKQDVDLGFSMDVNEEEDPKATSATSTISKTDEKDRDETILKEEKKENDSEEETENIEEDPWEGLKYVVDTETGEYVVKAEQEEENLVAECVSPLAPLPLEDLPLPLEEFLLDEALGLVDLDIEQLKEEPNRESADTEVGSSSTVAESSSSLSEIPDVLSQDSQESLDALTDMIQTPQFHHPHHRAFQSRMPFMRTMSMEQRWQDLANLLSFPGPTDGGAMHHPFNHHHHLHNYNHSHPHSMGYGTEATRGVLLHNATLAPPMGDVNTTVPFNNLGGTNLGNAVATSMNLTNSSEPMGESSSGHHYKLEPNHDAMYYQNNGSSEFNQTDGFLSSILNDEDLQLMDMAMNEGMYTMRMLETNNTPSSNVNLCSGVASGSSPMSRSEMERVDTSSDSAVSSMGSERVPSLSDGEWCDAGSDSGHNIGEHYVTDYQAKYRPYDYSYSNRQHNLSTTDPGRLPVAQKKHQMFGKRYFQEQGSATAMAQPPTPVKYEYRDPAVPATSFSSIPHQVEEDGAKPPEMKYSCTMEFNRHHPMVRNPISHIAHNHTYNLPPESSGVMPRPMSRDKTKSKKSNEEHLTRDEKRARALNIPITVDDIINLPMDEFNERLSKYDLSEAQLSLIRDIRRRGKNKVAAQNCRKRKLDQINTLADEVKEMRDRKMRLRSEYEYHTNELKRMKDKYQQLYRHVFQNLRDPDGNQYSPYHYSLQTSADGSVIVVPRSNSTHNPSEKKEHMQDHKNG
ncbi:segmentation protein cap'n'collar isoform X2 [Coccinella septempunctata]|uniref:segmentation protein cap'n'collar isoform X2 n=1 Tax=Coccinella septempunctata TaxID=41139 RepID=UPI001D0885F1|nr:segmentation protein cap'n'collar isoform X2 [Coccinella septempunctata]